MNDHDAHNYILLYFCSLYLQHQKVAIYISLLKSFNAQQLSSYITRLYRNFLQRVPVEA